MNLKPEELDFILKSAEIDNMAITRETLERISFDPHGITEKEKNDLEKLEGRKFKHTWQLDEALAEKSIYWRPRENDKKYNENLKHKLLHIYEKFRHSNN
jgi:hypothetical protein